MPRLSGKPPPRVRALLRAVDPYKSKLERDYAQHLELRRHAGEIYWWAYEAWKFRLASGAWYTPDFPLILPTGAIEIHETKGFLREAAGVRLRVAAGLYPWLRFKLVRRAEGIWTVEDIAP